jgi:hypothetical protein
MNQESTTLGFHVYCLAYPVPNSARYYLFKEETEKKKKKETDSWGRLKNFSKVNQEVVET